MAGRSKGLDEYWGFIDRQKAKGLTFAQAKRKWKTQNPQTKKLVLRKAPVEDILMEAISRPLPVRKRVTRKPKAPRAPRTHIAKRGENHKECVARQRIINKEMKEIKKEIRPKVTRLKQLEKHKKVCGRKLKKM